MNQRWPFVVGYIARNQWVGVLFGVAVGVGADELLRVLAGAH